MDDDILDDVGLEAKTFGEAPVSGEDGLLYLFWYDQSWAWRAFAAVALLTLGGFVLLVLL